jgi:hypothetical protein
MERITQFNLAELLFWSGELTEAFAGAQRAREIQARSNAEPSPDDTLLLARIQLARGERTEARDLARWAEVHCPAKAFLPAHRVLTSLVALQLDPPPAETREQRWRDLVAEARAGGFGSDALAEVFFAAAEATLPCGLVTAAEAFVREGLEAGGAVSRFRPRLEALRARLGAKAV